MCLGELTLNFCTLCFTHYAPDGTLCSVCTSEKMNVTPTVPAKSEQKKEGHPGWGSPLLSSAGFVFMKAAA